MRNLTYAQMRRIYANARNKHWLEVKKKAIARAKAPRLKSPRR